MRKETARSMRALAVQVQQSHPDMPVHVHLRDAAKTLEAGNEEGAQRHLRAAMFALTPQQVTRHGIHDDEGHIGARQAMDGVNRHLLLVKDIADVAARNYAAINRDSYGDDSTAPARRDPNAGYGPGANAQKPTARQPPGDQALNAPARTSAGKPDPNVASPDSPQPRGSKQFARSWDEICAVLDLATVNVRQYKRTVQTRNGPRVEVVGASARQTAAKAAADEEEEDVPTVSQPRGWIPQEKWIQGQKEWIARGEEARRRMTDEQLAKALRRHADNPRRSQNVVDELDRRDEEDKSARLRALYAETPKSEADRNRVYQGLVNEGENPEDAWAHAHGTNPEAMQKQAVIADLRAKGHKGGGFDALTRDAFKDEVRRRIVSAEAATNGYLLSPEGKKAGIDPWTLFTGPESRARKYASSELKEWWDQNGRPTAADFQANLMGKKAGAGRRDFYASVTWEDVAAVAELSARTPMLEATPAPYGVPGGPGLYDVKDNKHSDYFEQIVQALMHKRGMSKADASRVAWGALRRWESGKGNVHPEVRAAASGALGQEAQAAARARAAHGHSVTWDDLGAVVDLAVVDVKTYQRTVNTKNGPVRQTVVTHDQNYKAGMGQPAGGGGSSGGPQQGQQNGKAPYTQPPSKAAEKARLLATARSYRQRAALLGVEVAALNSALYNALYGSNTTKSQAGSTTAAQAGSTTAAQKGSTTTATTAAATTVQAAGTTATVGASTTPATSTAPASTGTTAAQAGATTAAQTGSTTAATAGSTTKAAAPAPSAAQQASTAALSAGATQAQVTQAQAQATKAAAGMSAPQLRTAIGQLQTRITWYNSQASALTAQAAKLP
jgi:hypothetical protein